MPTKTPNEIKELHKQRMKELNIGKIQKLMTKFGISYEDIDAYHKPSLRERLDTARSIVNHREKARRNLEKARQAQKEKREQRKKDE